MDDHEVEVTSQSSSPTWGGTDREPRLALGVPGELACGEVLLRLTGQRARGAAQSARDVGGGGCLCGAFSARP